MIDFAYKEGNKFIWPVAMRSRFNGVGGWHTLTDEQRATHGWYPIDYTGNLYNPAAEDRLFVSQELDGDIFKVVYVVRDLTIDELRATAKVECKKIRLERAFTGAPYDGNRFGSDENDINAIVTTAININTNFLTMAEATGGYWKSYNNGSVAMTQTEFLAMAKDVSLFLLKNKRGYHAAKTDIDAAADIAAVNLIVETYRTFDPLGV